jgi:hypothetical protein
MMNLQKTFSKIPHSHELCKTTYWIRWKDNLLKLQILTNLNPQNKLKDLIVKSAIQKEIAEDQFALYLGERVKHVEILNEKDCIMVKPRGWWDKQI